VAELLLCLRWSNRIFITTLVDDGQIARDCRENVALTEIAS